MDCSFLLASGIHHIGIVVSIPYLPTCNNCKSIHKYETWVSIEVSDVIVFLPNLKVDYFFVPPLTFLAEKLNLTPSVAGITLLALGNGMECDLNSHI